MALSGTVSLGLVGTAHAQTDLPWVLPPLRKIKVNGQEIAYLEQGSGPALVLVHGMSGSAAFEWGRVMGPLSARFRVVAPYQIGFGPSAQPDLPYDARSFVDYLGGFMDALGLEHPTIVGESFGGWVVAHYAVAQGGRTAWGAPLPKLSRLVIVDGAVHVRPSPPRADGGASQSINDPAVGKLAGGFFATQARADNSLVTRKVGQVIFSQAVTPAALKAIRTPSLVIWGDGDRLIPFADGQAIASEIRGARFAPIKDCGHIPSVERPHAFLEALTGFLSA